MKEFNQILIAEFISITGGLIAGYLLTIITKEISIIPGMLVMLPGFLELRGNISGSLSARISSGLHLGLVNDIKGELIKKNVISAVILTIITSMMIGLISYSYNLITGVNDAKVIIITILSALLSSAIMIPLTIISAIKMFKKGLNPDNIMGPYVTTLGDVVSLISLIIVTKTFLVSI